MTLRPCSNSPPSPIWPLTLDFASPRKEARCPDTWSFRCMRLKRLVRSWEKRAMRSPLDSLIERAERKGESQPPTVWYTVWSVLRPLTRGGDQDRPPNLLLTRRDGLKVMIFNAPNVILKSGLWENNFLWVSCSSKHFPWLLEPQLLWTMRCLIINCTCLSVKLNALNIRQCSCVWR